MSSIKVLVYDDLPDIASNLADKIRDAYSDAEVKPADHRDFQQLLKLINRRRTEWREVGNEFGMIDLHDADSADVVVVDYDLLRFSETTDTTGSRLAYLLRCFSKCGFIIVLNEFGTNTFDLSLGSPVEGFSDVHIGDVQIGNPGLWLAPFDGFDGYRPWHWPVVPEAKVNFEQCVGEVLENLEAPILKFLGLDHVIDWMPIRARDFLAGEQRIEEVTFESFVKLARGGISTKDELIPEQIARVAAARIVTLLNSIILPEQSVLVDAPHLVSRFPSLIQNGCDDLDTWNLLCNPVHHKIDELLTEGLEKHRFPKSHWLWRPAWYWPEINTNENIEEVKDPWNVKEVDWVFCEDISRFVPVKFARDFRAIVSPPFVKRFVFRSDSSSAKRYVRFLKDGGPQDLSQVNYVPQAAFNL